MLHSDPLDDAFEDLRISGTVLLHEAYSPPWAIAVPNEASLQKILGTRPDVRVLPFHLVRRQGFDLTMQREPRLRVDSPEVVICPTGVAHRLSAGRGGRVVALDKILTGDGPRPARVDDSKATELICGVFMVRAAPLNPMLSALPSVLKVSTGDASVNPILSSAATLLTMELDLGSRGGFTASRLLEVFYAEAIRAYQRTMGDVKSGWLRGLSDPKIAEAIRHVHADPAQRWTVELLATRIALSPSRFAARFREKIGKSVMSYIAEWRANTACRLLRDTDLPVSEVAHRVGYDSLPAFARAFKVQVGAPPAAWRATVAR